jgi:hypothetical protein
VLVPVTINKFLTISTNNLDALLKAPVVAHKTFTFEKKMFQASKDILKNLKGIKLIAPDIFACTYSGFEMGIEHSFVISVQFIPDGRMELTVREQRGTESKMAVQFADWFERVMRND